MHTSTVLREAGRQSLHSKASSTVSSH